MAAITSISPSSGEVGQGFDLTVYGSGFLDVGAAIMFDGVVRDTAVVDDGTLTTYISGDSVPHAGEYDVYVDMGGPSTNHVTFTATSTPPPGPDPDTTSPTIAITNYGSGYSTALDVVSLEGTASDNVDVTEVTWVNTATGSTGTATGTSTWAAEVPLTLGFNAIVVTAHDAADNTTSANILVVRITPAPHITSISPTSGPHTGGTAVTIGGSNFTEGSTVTFGGVAATNVVVVSSGTITCTTPAHTSGAINVAVIDICSQSSILVNGYTYASPPPTLTSLSPTSGLTTGGTLLTLTGTGFTSGATVTFGGDAATDVVVVSSTSLTCTTPAHAAGAVNVVVTNADSQAATRTNGYTYVAPPPTVSDISPTSGHVLGGTAVTITGTDFQTGAIVLLGGIAAIDVVVASSTSITCTTAAHLADTVDLVVTNPDTQSGTLTNAYTYTGTTIDSISPTSGLTTGGTNVTLLGTGFIDGATVSIGGVPATSVLVVSGQEIQCVTGAHVAGVVDVAVTNPDAQVGTLSSGFTYVNPSPVIDSISPVSGESVGGTSVTLVGSGFLDGATVTFGGDAATSVVVTSTSITCTTPKHGAGSVDVVVTNADDQSDTLSAGFTYEWKAVVTLEDGFTYDNYLTRARISSTYLEAPSIGVLARFSQANLEVPYVATCARVSSASLEVPDVPSLMIWLDAHDGKGYQDFSKFIYEVPTFEYRKSEPTLVDMSLVEISTVPGWQRPVRGMRVKLIDGMWASRFDGVPDNVIFTGYITDEPRLQTLGVNGGQPVYGYVIHMTSDDILANRKVLPAKTYLNATHGFILKDLLNTMFGGSVPFATTGIQDGGTERLYQVDVKKKFSEIALAFGEADGYVFHCLDSYMFYQPEAEVNAGSLDPVAHWTIDEADPRYNPDNANITPISDEIYNDVTVLGEDEPTTVVTEHFLSDGYTGEHELAYEPFGTTHNVLLSDDFTEDLDTGIWQKADRTIDPYIRIFEGSLNVIGGNGTNTGETYLRARKGVELSGILNIKDGELAFQPTPHGVGILGGLYSSEAMTEANLWCGWKLDQTDSPSLIPWGPLGAETAAAVALNTKHHYILRRIIDVQAPPPAVTRGGYTAHIPTPTAVISWLLEEINDDFPEAIVKTTRLVLSKRYTAAPPEYVLYAPVVPYDCNLVLNFVQVTKPQQATVLVNNIPVAVGPYMDGGRCAIVNDGPRSKLAWYAINQGSSGLTYRDAVVEDKPLRYWRLGEASGATVVYDATAFGPIGNAVNVEFGTTGALYGDNDTAATFRGNGYITIPRIDNAGSLTVEAWIRTTDRREFAPVLGRVSTDTSVAVGLHNGVPGFFSGVVNRWDVLATADIADGKWHHVAWVFGLHARWLIYIDGVLDKETANGAVIGWLTSAMRLGHDGGSNTYFSGDLDEVALYDSALTDYRLRVHYLRATQSISEIVTIPPQGSRISVSYRRNDAARARVQHAGSIASEAALYGDNGIRQIILQKDEVKPPARTSAECLAVARAYLADKQATRYEGSYSFDTVIDTPAELKYWPLPGDIVHCDLATASGSDVHSDLTITNVNVTPLGLGAWRFDMEFGAVNQFDVAQRDLMRLRASSLSELSIEDITAVTDETVDTVERPDDPVNYTVVSITSSAVGVTMTPDGVMPTGVTGYEVRSSDSGWGAPGYVARSTSATLSLTRTTRDGLWFVRPYNVAGNYSERSALIRVTYPLANNMVISGLDGEVSTSLVRLYVPTPRDPDFGGIIVRHDSETGVVAYEGDGIQTKRVQVDAIATVSVGRITLELPNVGAIANPIFSVAAYNVAGELSPWVSVTITKPLT